MKKSYLLGLLLVFGASAFGMPQRQRIADIAPSHAIDESTIITDLRKVGTSTPEIITELPPGWENNTIFHIPRRID